jgi:amidase
MAGSANKARASSARLLLAITISAALLTLLPGSRSRPLSAHGTTAAAAGEQEWRFRLEEATIEDVHRAITTGQLTATQLVQLYLNRIAAYNGRCVEGEVDPATGLQLGEITPVENAGQLNALITLNIRGQRSQTDPIDDDPTLPDALEVARQLDAAFAATGRLVGPLHGIPFAIKDQFDTRDMRTTSGAAAAYANDRPPQDAEVVARLRAAGAIILAKANMGEYAAGDRSTYGGVTCNPYDTTRSAGRSSGGSGAAVAANLVMCALAEETGPSARNPAANNSLVGIVATHSLISRAGLIPASATRDRPGILCRTVRDAAIVLGVLAGFDPKDPATAASIGQVPPEPYVTFTTRPSLNGVRIGVVREFMQVFTDADRDSVRIAEEAIADLARHGAEIVDPVDFQSAIAEIVPVFEPALLGTSVTRVQDNAFVTSTTPPMITDLVRITSNPAALPSDGPSGINLRRLADLAFGVTTVGEVQYMLNQYLQQRGDPNIQSVHDLLTKSIFYDFPYVSAQTIRTIVDDTVTASRVIPGDGITNPANARLFDLLFRTEDLADGTKRTSPITTLDIRGVVVRRATLQAVVAKVMADNKLDALVYPTKTLPAPILGAAVAPPVDNRLPLAWTLSPIAGLPAIAVPAGFTREVLDWQPPPVITQEVLVDGNPTLIRVYDPELFDPRRFAPAKNIALPVSIDFLGTLFSEPKLLQIAAAYENITRHRRPPPGFPPLPGEP